MGWPMRETGLGATSAETRCCSSPTGSTRASAAQSSLARVWSIAGGFRATTLRGGTLTVSLRGTGGSTCSAADRVLYPVCQDGWAAAVGVG